MSWCRIQIHFNWRLTTYVYCRKKSESVTHLEKVKLYSLKLTTWFSTSWEETHPWLQVLELLSLTHLQNRKFQLKKQVRIHGVPCLIFCSDLGWLIKSYNIIFFLQISWNGYQKSKKMMSPKIIHSVKVLSDQPRPWLHRRNVSLSSSSWSAMLNFVDLKSNIWKLKSPVWKTPNSYIYVLGSSVVLSYLRISFVWFFCDGRQ